MDIFDVYVTLTLDASAYNKSFEEAVGKATELAAAVQNAFSAAGKSIESATGKMTELAATAGTGASAAGKSIEQATGKAMGFAAAVKAGFSAAGKSTSGVIHNIVNSVEKLKSKITSFKDSVQEAIKKVSSLTAARGKNLAAADKSMAAAGSSANVAANFEKATKAAKDFAAALKNGLDTADKSMAAAGSSANVIGNFEKATQKASGFSTTLKKGFVVAGAVLSEGDKLAGKAVAAIGKASWEVVSKAGEAAAKAAVKLGEAVVEAYGNYEKLGSGVETVFGSSSDQVTKFANDAFKTTQMSASEYLKTLSGFSAQLLKSLDGDAAAAADHANGIVTDMADNASKTGASIEELESAYQGFAEGNFSMLDSLKLGYGGTKEEMEKLLKEASAISGVEYDVSNFADVADAIHVVQNEMGITGSAAEEASASVNGSIDTLKAAFSNFLTGLGDSDADVGELAQNVVDSFSAVAENIAPVLQNIVDALPAVVETIIGALNENFPVLLEAAAELLNGLLEGIVELLPVLIPVVISALMMVVNALLDNIDLLIEAAVTLLTGLAVGLITAIPILIEKIPEIIAALFNAIVENAPKLLEAGGQLITMLGQGIANMLASLNTSVGGLVSDNIVQPISDMVSEFIGAGRNLIMGLWNGISNGTQWVRDKISVWVQDLTSWFKKKLGINSPSRVMRDEVGKYIALGLATGIENNLEAVKQAISEADNLVTGGFSAAISYGGGTPAVAGGVQIVQNIASVPQTPVELAAATAAYFEQARWT